MKTTAKMRDDLRNYKERGSSLLRDTLLPDVLDDLDEAVRCLRLLWKEVESSGNAFAIDYGWTDASKATMAFLRDSPTSAT